MPPCALFVYLFILSVSLFISDGGGPRKGTTFPLVILATHVCWNIGRVAGITGCLSSLWAKLSPPFV